MKTLLSLLSLIFLYSCMHNQTNHQSQTLSVIHEEVDEESKSESNSYKKLHKTHIDTLLSQTRTQGNYAIIPGDINNIQKMNGFRGIKLKMNFNSIDFGNAGINERYINKNIKIVTTSSHKNNINIIGDYDILELTFLDNKLSQIKIFNEYRGKGPLSVIRTDSDGKEIKSYYDYNINIQSTYGLLVDLFSKPNVDSKYLKKQKSESFTDIAHGQYYNLISCSWKLKDIVISYDAVEYFSLNQYNMHRDNKRAEIYFKLIGDISKIIENINFIEDSLKFKSKKDNLQKKF